MSTPAAAPRPVATITAVGTARPMAHGQAMMSTATAAANARTSGASSTATNHTTNVAMARDRTTGTKTRADAVGEPSGSARATPARRASGGRSALQHAVGSQVAGAVAEGARAVDRAADHRVARPLLDTGRLSPVSIDSSTALAPLTTTPSTGTSLPGPHDDDVAGHHLRQGDVHVAAAADDARRLRLQVGQRAQGGGRLRASRGPRTCCRRG